MIYTKKDLKALSRSLGDFSLSPEQMSKFDVIEVGDPTPNFSKRRDPEAATEDPSGSSHHTNSSSGPASSGTGRGRGGGDRERERGDDRCDTDGGREEGSRNGNRRNNPQPNARFAAPSNRSAGWRGNRDQETFVEGLKYELERNAEHQRNLQETIQREERREEKQQKLDLQQQAREVHQTAQQRKEEDAEGKEEIERLLAGINVGDEKAGSTRRSRFFSGDGNTTTANEAGALAGPAASDNSRWRGSTTTRTDAANWSNHAPAPTTSSVVVGGMAIAGGVANVSMPSVPPAGAGASHHFVTSPAAVNPSHSEPLLLPRSQQSQPTPRQPPQSQVWQVQDLENMLHIGVKPTTPVQPTPQTSQPQLRVMPTQGVINAAELESILLQQVRNSRSSSNVMSLSAPQQQVMSPPQQQLQPQQLPMMTPSHPVSSGTRTPPQHLMPAVLAGQPMGITHQSQQQLQPPNPWLAAAAGQQHLAPKVPPKPQGVPGKIPGVPIAQNGLPISLMMHPGQYFTTAPPTPQFYMPPGQQQQAQPAIYHRPDARIFITPDQQQQQQQAAAMLFHQQAQRQAQQQRR